MNLRNQVLKKSRILYWLLVIGVIGLTALFYYVSTDGDNAIRILGIVLMIITALYAIPLFILNIPTKSFDKYYEMLSEAERERFEAELQRNYCNQMFTITSKEIVIIDSVLIRVIEIGDILSMKKRSRRFIRYMSYESCVILYMKGGKTEVITEMPDYKLDMIIQDLLERNPNIVQLRF